jgi:hypothetical protein
MSAPKIPNPWTINTTTNVGGALDAGLDDIHIKEIGPIALTTTSTVNSDSKVDLGLDDIRIKELPRIELQVQTAMKPTRVHFPVNFRFGLSTLGMELVAFSICGESMVIVEDYVPHETEICR